MTDPKPLTSKNLTRREFLKSGLAAAGTAAATFGAAQLLAGCSPVQDVPAASPISGGRTEQIVKTTCALCPSGCGLDVRVVNGRAVKVEGSALHPLNQGVCCLKGQASLEILYSPERLPRPRRQLGLRGSGDWEEISWEDALQIVADRLGELRNSGLAHTVALMHGETRGQMRSLIERFMSAYGSPNVISHESLGEGAARLGMLLTQGVNGLPVYDFNNANYVMTFGGNLLESSRNVIGSLGAIAFMRRGRPQRGKLVVVHPRLSLSGMKGDEWIPIRPGTYAALALGMANVMINSGLYDADFVRDFTFGFEDFADADGTPHKGFKNLVLEQYSLERVSAITGVATEVIARLAGEFATNRPAVAVLPTERGEFSNGNAMYTAMAVHALNALVGSIDCPGGVLVQRFPTLAEWPDYTPDASTEHGLVKPRIDGAGTTTLPLAASAYQQVARNITAENPYPLNALILYNTNPVYEVPDQARAVEALLKVPFVVSFASTLDESAAHADLILPACTFLERWGDDFIEGTGFRGVSLRQPVVEPVHDTRNPADVLLTLAGMLGGPVAQALPWQNYKDLVFDRLSAIDMDLDKFMTNGNWSEMVYFNALPGSPAWDQVVGRDRLNAPRDGRFDFFSRELFAVLSDTQPELAAEQRDLASLPHFELPSSDEQSEAEYPLLLVTQPLIPYTPNWYGVIPTLQEAYGLQTNVKWGSWVEINPQVAEALQIEDGELVVVESQAGQAIVQARVYPGLWPNVVYMPPGLGHHTLISWGRNSPANSVVGTNPYMLQLSTTEPLSGQAVLGPTRVRIFKA